MNKRTLDTENTPVLRRLKKSHIFFPKMHLSIKWQSFKANNLGIIKMTEE